jgi:hypothetical protein
MDPPSGSGTRVATKQEWDNENSTFLSITCCCSLIVLRLRTIRGTKASALCYPPAEKAIMKDGKCQGYYSSHKANNNYYHTVSTIIFHVLLGRAGVYSY